MCRNFKSVCKTKCNFVRGDDSGCFRCIVPVSSEVRTLISKRDPLF